MSNELNINTTIKQRQASVGQTDNDCSAPPRLLTPKETGILIGGENKPIPPATLANWRSQKKYPELRPVHIGRHVRYHYEDVIAFIRSRTAQA